MAEKSGENPTPPNANAEAVIVLSADKSVPDLKTDDIVAEPDEPSVAVPPLELSEDMMVDNRKEPQVSFSNEPPQRLGARYADDRPNPSLAIPTAVEPAPGPRIGPPGMGDTIRFDPPPAPAMAPQQTPIPMGGQHNSMPNNIGAVAPLSELRRLGWSLAQHNETMVDNKVSIMYMFVHNARGIFVQAYGANETEALNSAYIGARQSMDAVQNIEAEAGKVAGLNQQLTAANNEVTSLRNKLQEIQAKLSTVASLFNGS